MDPLKRAAAHLPMADYDLVPPVEPFALDQAGVNNTIWGVRTGSGQFVAKVYTSYADPASIHYEHQMLNWLAGRKLSFAVPVPIPARDGRLVVGGPGVWMSLMRRLPGVCPELRLVDGRRDPRALLWAELLGSAMGELQVALRSYPPLGRPGRPLFGLLFGFPRPRFDPFTLTPAQLGLPDTAAYAEQLAWWRSKAARLQAFVDGPFHALPQQICHNDVTPANVLIADGHVTAVLDFEFATLAPRALDVAMGLRIMMWDNPEPWEMIGRFCRGYTRWRHLTEAEVLALPMLLRLRTAIPFLWWLGRPNAQADQRRPDLHIEKLQRLDRWLARQEGRLVELLLAIAT